MIALNTIFYYKLTKAKKNTLLRVLLRQYNQHRTRNCPQWRAQEGRRLGFISTPIELKTQHL